MARVGVALHYIEELEGGAAERYCVQSHGFDVPAGATLRQVSVVNAAGDEHCVPLDVGALRLRCPHCGKQTRPHELAELDHAIALYSAHLVETHFEILEAGRDMIRAHGGRAGHDAWTRL